MNFIRISGFCFLILLYVLQSSGCSPTSFKDLPRHTDDNPRGWYRFLKRPKIQCDEKYEDIKLPSKTGTSDHKACPELLKVANIMKHGYNYLPSNMNLNDITVSIRCTGKTIRIDGSASLIPDGMLVEIVNEYDVVHTNYDKTSISDQWLSALGGEIEENLNVRLETYTDLLQKKKADSIMGIRQQFITYMVHMENPEPGRALLFRYRSLHENLFHNITTYVELIARYGTHVRLKTSHGGIVEYIPKENNDKYEINNENDVNFNIGGILEGGINQWLQSLNENLSVVLTSTVIPIYEFIEPNSQSQKKKSLQKMHEYIMNHVRLQHILKALQVLNSDYFIAIFIRNTIIKHLQYICCSEELVNLIENWVIKADNINFDRFQIKCIHDRWFWPAKGEEYVITRIFKLLPGLCFTKEVKFSTCVNVHFTLPAGISCVNFYSEDGCTGKIYAQVSSEENLADALINAKSFAYC